MRRSEFLFIVVGFSVALAPAVAFADPSSDPRAEGMRRLPGGTFRSQYGRGEYTTVQPFWLDSTPVTAKAYAACVKAKNCAAPHDGGDCTYGSQSKERHPINCVDWNEATTFCAVAGKRLPTDAEWEWAARAAEFDTELPWGASAIGVKYCAFSFSGRATTCPVGTFPRTDSPQGIRDLLGNVMEWTSTCWDSSCAERVVRGSSFAEDALVPPFRGKIPPATRRETYGFRCAKAADPDPDPRIAVMKPVPGGRFTPGDAQQPVTVEPFEMDVTEVTVAAYRVCVDAAKCSAAADGPGCNFGRPDRMRHPVNCVDFAQASAFCAFAGKRLPTAEEWEWAARGATRGTMYPWGDESPASRICPRAGTCAVGTYPRGNSPQGIADLAGNVWEWTSSAFDEKSRVVRGGSWDEAGWFLEAAHGGGYEQTTRSSGGGFRCVR